MSTFPQVSLRSLSWRAGKRFRDGARVRYVSYYHSGTIHSVGQKNSGAFHAALEEYGMRYFARKGFRIFPRHIAVHGANGWADFAAAYRRRVILVEAVTDWREPADTLRRKEELAKACELWFVAETYTSELLRKRGYRVTRISGPPKDEMDSKFWLCSPPGIRPLP